jgi:hypothetical protein
MLQRTACRDYHLGTPPLPSQDESKFGTNEWQRAKAMLFPAEPPQEPVESVAIGGLWDSRLDLAFEFLLARIYYV